MTKKDIEQERIATKYFQVKTAEANVDDDEKEVIKHLKRDGWKIHSIKDDPCSFSKIYTFIKE